MTEAETIRGLELCIITPHSEDACLQCPYRDSKGICAAELMEDALGTITRQQVELDALDNARIKANATIEKYFGMERVEK